VLPGGPESANGKVFLARVGWRPSSLCTGFGHPINLFNSGIGALETGKAISRSEPGHSQTTVPLCQAERGLVSIGAYPESHDGGPMQAPRFTGGVADGAFCFFHAEPS